jgi:hypothetical protein
MADKQDKSPIAGITESGGKNVRHFMNGNWADDTEDQDEDGEKEDEE